jgi:hypothetical protein
MRKGVFLGSINADIRNIDKSYCVSLYAKKVGDRIYVYAYKDDTLLYQLEENFKSVVDAKNGINMMYASNPEWGLYTRS